MAGSGGRTSSATASWEPWCLASSLAAEQVGDDDFRAGPGDPAQFPQGRKGIREVRKAAKQMTWSKKSAGGPSAWASPVWKK